MSCFMVSERHVQVMVTGILATRPSASVETLCRRARYRSKKGRRARVRLAELRGMAVDLGQALTLENWRSVSHRYAHKPDFLKNSEPFPYRHAHVRVDLITLYKSVLCYLCQSDEHPRAELAASWRAAERFTAWCEARGASQEHPAYDAAPWGLS